MVEPIKLKNKESEKKKEKKKESNLISKSPPFVLVFGALFLTLSLNFGAPVGISIILAIITLIGFSVI